MIVTVDRFDFQPSITWGLLMIERLFNSFTVEDTYRPDGTKIYGKTCIPMGVYKVRVTCEGRIHEKYKQTFGEWHKGMLLLENVPNYDGIMFHIGNTIEHTEGCILPNDSFIRQNAVYGGASSKEAYKRFYETVIDFALKDDLTCEVRRWR